MKLKRKYRFKKSRIYSFRNLTLTTILVQDLHLEAYSKDAKQAMLTHGSGLSLPLSYDKNLVELHSSFVKLHDNEQFKAAGCKNEKVSKKKAAAKRFNTKIVNRFSAHGQTQRTAKSYASAISALLILGRRYTTTAVDIASMYASLIKLQGACSIFGRNFIKYSIMKKSTRSTDNLSKYLENLGSSTKDIYSTSFVFNRLQKIAPIYSAVPTRVDKAKYKNLRGRGGKYTVSVKKIPQNKGVIYALMYLKTSWTFSQQSTHANKFLYVMLLTLFYPKSTLGYVVSRKVVQKMLEK